MPFCGECGYQMKEGAKFCLRCGAKVKQINAQSSVICPSCGDALIPGKKFCANCGWSQDGLQENRHKHTKREEVFEGDIHKCPNCGEIVTAFSAFCTTCGYEFRNLKAATSVYEFTLKLNEISNRELPDYPEERSSLLKSLLGMDFNKHTTYNEILKKFEEQKIKDKAQLIRNFPVPNTAEDILEFLSLIKSNANDKNKDLRAAWEGKLEQIYEKAKICIKDDARFDVINKNYLETKKLIWRRKYIVLITIAITYLICLIYNAIISLIEYLV